MIKLREVPLHLIRDPSYRELTSVLGACGQTSYLLVMAAVGADLVAYAANRSNERAVVSGIHLAAKIVDVDVHDIRRGVKIKFPHLLDNGGGGNGLALVAPHELQQSRPLWAEIDLVKPPSHRATDTISFHGFNPEHPPPRAAAPPAYRPNARH